MKVIWGKYIIWWYDNIMIMVMLQMQAIFQSMLVAAVLEKIKETRLKLSQGSVTVLLKMANYEQARV